MNDLLRNRCIGNYIDLVLDFGRVINIYWEVFMVFWRDILLFFVR